MKQTQISRQTENLTDSNTLEDRAVKDIIL